MSDAILDAALDSFKMLPFLIITYLFMEYLETHASGKISEAVKNSGRLGPVIGGIAGIAPQCGFSTAASNLYAGKVITAGTLLAIFLSTSDEMLPLFISEQVEVHKIALILIMKAGIGIFFGLLFDFMRKNVFKKEPEAMDIHSLCVREDCHCDEGEPGFKDMKEVLDLKHHDHGKNHGVVKPALRHSIKIFFFILIVTVLINIAVEVLGEDSIKNFLNEGGILIHFAAGLIGLIPNCAASVFLTEFYLDGIIGFGPMMSGLLCGAGLGLLVLFRVNNDLKKNLSLLGILYSCGVFSGIILDILNISL